MRFALALSFIFVCVAVATLLALGAAGREAVSK